MPAMIDRMRRIAERHEALDKLSISPAMLAISAPRDHMFAGDWAHLSHNMQGGVCTGLVWPDLLYGGER